MNNGNRETANIWWILFLMPFQFPKMKVSVWFNGIIGAFKSQYFWQDSFRTHYKRFFGCKHEHIQYTYSTQAAGKKIRYEVQQIFCYDCYSCINLSYGKSPLKQVKESESKMIELLKDVTGEE